MARATAGGVLGGTTEGLAAAFAIGGATGFGATGAGRDTEGFAIGVGRAVGTVVIGGVGLPPKSAAKLSKPAWGACPKPT